MIVSWNARDFLRDCLKSLSEGVSEYPIEILVVDNASSDGSADCVEREFPHVRLIRSASNLGFSRANNLAVRQSTGDYVCLINSDVKVHRECITRLVDYCEAHPEVGLAGPFIFGPDGKLQRSCWGFPSVWNMFCRALALDKCFPRLQAFGGYELGYWSQDTTRPVDILGGCFWVARREALNRVGLLDESFFMYGEDMDWCRRFWAGGWQVMFVAEAQATHYGGASSANAPVRFYIERQRADLQYWTKHHSRAGVAAYGVVSALHNAVRVAGYGLASWVTRNPEHRHKWQRSLACLQFLLSCRWQRPSPPDRPSAAAEPAPPPRPLSGGQAESAPLPGGEACRYGWGARVSNGEGNTQS